MVEVYHYTSKRTFEDIDNSKTSRRLIPKNYLIHQRMKSLPKKAYNLVIYALLDSNPKEWTKNLDFPNIWNSLQFYLKNKRNGSSKILLRFDLTESDDAYVLERAHLEKNRDLIRRGKHPYEAHVSDCKMFFESRVPILDYNGGFSLPEVVIFSPIDFERLENEKNIARVFLEKFWKS